MVFVMALLLVTAFIMLGYLFIGMDIYADIELQQMVPKAEAIRQLLLEYIGGSMTSDAFVHMSESFIRRRERYSVYRRRERRRIVAV